MNAAARVLEQTHHLEGRLGSILLTGRLVWVLMLLVLVLSSAFAVVYERNVYHNTVTENQGLQQAHHEMKIKAKQLWLEQSVWATPERIQTKAVNELAMIPPINRAVVISKS
jgi:cell division protein FtsL